MDGRGRTLEDRVAGFLARTEGQVRGRVLAGYPLARLTTFRIGGPAALVAVPVSRDETDLVRESAAACGLPVKVLGKGSNILASDRGFPGVIILKAMRGIGKLNEDKGIVEVDAGVSLNRLVRWCAERGLKGLEPLAGIPGTLGGAVVNNSGARGLEISGRLREALVFEEGRGWSWRGREEMGFRYRGSALSGIIDRVRLELEAGDAGEALGECRRHLEWRKASQPLSRRSAGSVFKNGEGYQAGRLIEECGCKGWRVGDAVVSEKHANFIVNAGRARARQVDELIEKVRERVYAKEGIRLELEIERLGDLRPAGGAAGRRRDG